MRRIFRGLVFILILGVVICSLLAFRVGPTSSWLYDYKVSILEPIFGLLRPLPAQRDWYSVTRLDRRGAELAQSMKSGDFNDEAQTRFVAAYRDAQNNAEDRTERLDNSGKTLAAHELAATAAALTSLHEQLAMQIGNQKKVQLSESTLRALHGASSRSYEVMRGLEDKVAGQLQSQEFAASADDAVNEAMSLRATAEKRLSGATTLHQVTKRAMAELLVTSGDWLDESRQQRSGDFFVASLRDSSFARASAHAVLSWLEMAEEFPDLQLIYEFPWAHAAKE